MWIYDNNNYAIRGTSVTGFSLDNSVINGTNGNNGGSPYNDGSVKFDNLNGSATVSNTNISGGFNDNFRLVNTGGSLNRITFTNVTFEINGSTPNNDALSIEALSNAVVNVTVQNSNFKSAAGDLFQLNNNGSGATDLVFSNNTLANSHPAIATGGGGVTIDGGSVTFHIDHNTFRDAVGHALLIVKTTDTNTLQGTFDANTIGVAAVANSGSAEGDGLKVQSAGGGTVTVAITGNQIHQYNNFGIELLTGGGATAQSGAFNATITGNLIDTPGNTAGTIGLPKNGIHLNGGTVPGDTYAICAQLGGAGALANSIATAGKDAVPATVGDMDFRLRQRQATTVRLPGYSGANNDNTAVQNYIAANNGGNGVPVGLASNTVPTGGGFVGGAACASPIVMLPNSSKDVAQARPETNPLVDAQAEILNSANTFASALGSTSQITQTINTNSKAASPVSAGKELVSALAAASGSSNLSHQEKAALDLPAEIGTHTSRLLSARRAPAKSGETVSATIGTLPAGKTVTIIYRVTVDALDPGEVRTKILNQGTISGSNFASVTTTDPSPSPDPFCSGSAPKTCTPVDRPDTTVSSINRRTPSTTSTNAAAVVWRVTFANPVAGLTSSNFTLANTGLTAPSITTVSAVTASPDTQWDVTVNTGTGNGTLGLNMVNDTGLSHDVTNLPFTGEVYTIDKTAPMVASIKRQSPASNPTNADLLVFRVTFNEPVTNVGANSFVVTGTTTTIDAGSITAITPNLVFDFSVNGSLNGNLSTLNGTVGLDIAPSPTIIDMAGNTLQVVEPTPAATNDQTYTLDNAAPTVTIIPGGRSA